VYNFCYRLLGLLNFRPIYAILDHVRPRVPILDDVWFQLLPPTKEEVNEFARVCLFVCLLARLLKNACMDLDEMLRVNKCRDMDELINFCEPAPDHSQD